MKKFKIVILGVIALGVGSVIAVSSIQRNLLIPNVGVKNDSVDYEPRNAILVDEKLEEGKVTQEKFNKEDSKNIEPVKETTNSLSDSNKPTENKKTNDTSKKNENSSSKDLETKKDTQVFKETEPDVKPPQISNEEVKVQEPKKEETVKDTTFGKPVPFYESITHGEKEFYTENEALNRGLEIAKNELNYVMDYNEEHPEAQISPDINYYRVYPSFVDENGHTWYYLHFFCQSGEGNDKKLKNMY